MHGYPDTAIHKAAGLLHHRLGTTAWPPTPQDLDAALSHHLAWKSIPEGSPAEEALRASVQELTAGAANVGEWAVELGHLGLTPHAGQAWRTPESADVAVLIAVRPDLLPAFQREVVRAIDAAVDDVYSRLLGLTPAPSPRAAREALAATTTPEDTATPDDAAARGES